MSLKDSPEYYHEVLKRIPPRAVPAFEDEAMQAGCGAGAGACTTTWGRSRWSSSTGPATRSA
jgi:hypothetical protein